MPILLARLLTRFEFLRNWGTPIAVIVALFVTSWPLMALAEGGGSEIADPANYWWWFVVTASTVGYGDLYPATAAGHVVGGYVIVGGIVTLTTIFTNLAAALERARGRRMQGTITVDASDHLVVIGYTAGRTERIMDELLAEEPRRVVLCAGEDVGTHPMPGRDLEFVRGEPTDSDVLLRAGVHRASSVLIDVGDDNEALAVAVTVRHVRRAARVVVTLRDMARSTQLGYVDPVISCVQWHTPRMVTEELQSPGIAEVYTELMTHGGENTYSATLPVSLGTVRFGDCQVALGRARQAIVLAARTEERLLVNPAWEAELPAATMLYYIASAPLTPEQISAALRDS